MDVSDYIRRKTECGGCKDDAGYTELDLIGCSGKAQLRRHIPLRKIYYSKEEQMKVKNIIDPSLKYLEEQFDDEVTLLVDVSCGE